MSDRPAEQVAKGVDSYLDNHTTDLLSELRRYVLVETCLLDTMEDVIHRHLETVYQKGFSAGTDLYRNPPR